MVDSSMLTSSPHYYHANPKHSSITNKRGISHQSAPISASMEAIKEKKKQKMMAMATATATATGKGKGAATHAYSRGMFLAFIDNAFAERRLGRNEHYNELVAQFKAFGSGAGSSSSSSAFATPPSSSTTTSTSNGFASPSSAPSSGQLRSWMEALTHVVASLDRSHSLLVEAVVSLPWTTMDEPIVYAYTRFVQALLCSRSEFVQMTLERIVRAFRFQSGMTYSHDSSPDSNNTSPGGAGAITRRQTYERLHALLQSLLYLIPTLPGALWPVIHRHFPHKRENRNAQVVYMANALRIVEYCPQLGENVLGAVILRAIQMDVEIQVDIEDLEDDEGVLDEEVFGFSLENPFDRLVGDEDEDSDSDEEDDEALDVDAISSDDGSDDEEDDRPDDDTLRTQAEEEAKEKILSPKIIKRLKEMAAKLDAILKVVFDFLHRLNTASCPSSPLAQSRAFPSFTSGGNALAQFPHSSLHNGRDMNHSPDPTRLTFETAVLLRRAILDVLLHLFDEKLLRTFQTRHVQFVLFWSAAHSPEFADQFTGNLVGRVLDDRDTPAVTRVAAAGYVASFVSRATAIDRAGARKVVQLLCSYLEDELDAFRASFAGGTAVLDERTLRNSVVFYAVCQATFYIFCFRWRDLLDDNVEEEDLENLDGLPVARRWMADLEILKMAISSPLNPLQLCAPTVVSQFARMAHKTDFMYVHSIIEANKRSSRSRRSSVSLSNDSTPLPTPSLATPNPTSRPASLPRNLSSAASATLPTENYIVQQTLKDAQIDSHFPFDPYKLPLSASYLQGIYRNWDSGGLDDDETEDEGSDDDEDDDNSSAAVTETGEDSSMASSSVDAVSASFHSNSSASTSGFENRIHPPTPARSLPIKGMIDPTLLSASEDDADDQGGADFSKSFEAMSVSPRRPSVSFGLP